jgi:hypothetical protein
MFFCKKYSLFSTCENCYIWIVKIEEAIVYCLASSGRGMRSEQIADMINRQRLHLRKDGQPVTSKQVFYVVTHNAHTFALAEGRIMLII